MTAVDFSCHCCISQRRWGWRHRCISCGQGVSWPSHWDGHQHTTENSLTQERSGNRTSWCWATGNERRVQEAHGDVLRKTDRHSEKTTESRSIVQHMPIKLFVVLYGGLKWFNPSGVLGTTNALVIDTRVLCLHPALGILVVIFESTGRWFLRPTYDVILTDLTRLKAFCAPSYMYNIWWQTKTSFVTLLH